MAEKRYEICPKCGAIAMPAWHDNSQENARMCQNAECKFVEEKSESNLQRTI